MGDRYARQTILPVIGEEGQARLAASTVAIVGLGGLGTTTAELLCRAGVGTLILVDYDVVALSNLQRQSLYDEKDVGAPKVTAAAEHLRRINAAVKINSSVKQINMTTLSLLDEAELILDCTDNLQARFLLNEYCMKRRVPFIYCGAVETRGLLYVVDPVRKERACFNCLFEKLTAVENCEDFGVLNTTTHLAATLQTAEAFKLLLNQHYTEGLISFDAWDLRAESYNVKKKPDCNVCNGVYDRLSGKVAAVEFCVTKRCIKARPNTGMELDIKKIVRSKDVLVKEDYGVHGAVIVLDGQAVLVSSSGALEFLTTKDQDRARALTEKVYRLGEKAK